MVMRQQKRCVDCMYFRPQSGATIKRGTCYGLPMTVIEVPEDNWACTLFDDGEEPRTVQIPTGRRDMRVE